ncbi:MAG: NAD(P)/FAD-dependent oxidoreductase [Acidobacteriota bacterium]
MRRERSVDVVILGGGPAGSTAASILARAGIGAVVLEREAFPRFHVGESLLPHSLPLLDELGVHDTVRALPHTRRKDGATFVTHDGSRQVVYWFDTAFAPAIPHAYQVRRDEFDKVLLDHARSLGVEVLEGWQAQAPVWERNRLVGVKAKDQDGEDATLRCRAFLDASGQSAFLASRMGWRFPYPRHRKVASVAHFADAWLPDGRERGNITIVLAEGGWFWLIPFADDTVSVGAVMDVGRWRALGPDPETLFNAATAATPEVGRRLANARRLIPFTAIQNFSFRVMRIAGDGFCLLGDAAGFLDPIFSTGVFLATTTASSAAQDIADAFRRHGRVEAHDFGPTIALTRSLHRLFFTFIRAYYNPHFLAFFFAPGPAFHIPEAIVSLLAADVMRPGRWRRTSRFRALLGLAWLQEQGSRMGRTLVPPLTATPAGSSR